MKILPYYQYMSMNAGTLGLGILVILLVGSFSFSAFAQDQSLSIIENYDNFNSAKFIPGQLVVGLERPDPSFNDKVTLHGGQIISSIEEINAFVVKVPLNAEDKFISSISNNPNVSYVERDSIMTALYIPNDEFYPLQWGLQRIGMESAWEPNPSLGLGIIVAVVDTGIYDNHPDFAGTNILTNSDWDFVDNDDDTRPTRNCGNSAEYHGTFVAGIIGATKNNTIGVAGIGPFDILPVRVLNHCGSGSSSAVANGILWAKNHGASVINLSLGSSVPSTTILNAVNAAHVDGVVLVAASGNDGNTDVLYPAGFVNVISVGATTTSNNRASYSQYGPTLELVAPGGSSGACSSSGTPYIVSTGVGKSGSSTYFTYLCGTGTSFAAPHVSGVAGLVKAANPLATNEEIRLHLQQTSQDLGPCGYDVEFGHGLVRADTALNVSINSVNFLSPCAHYEFENNLSDSTGNGNHGTFSGTENYATGVEGKAFDFLGSNYVTVGTESNFDYDITDPFSISFWVQPDSSGIGFPVMFAKTDLITRANSDKGYGILYGESSELIVFRLFDGTTPIHASVVSTASSVPVDDWTHITITYDGDSNQNGMKIYINGALDKTGGSKALSNSIENDKGLAVGAESDGGSKFKGQIDNLRVYGFELSDVQVNNLFNSLGPALPTISINDVTKAEGDSGSTDFTFNVTRSDNSGGISVDYVTADDTADSGDYTPISSTTLNFTDGGLTTQTITVSVIGDTELEPDETFFVNLSNCVLCTISDSQGVGTITDDDEEVVVDIAIAQYNAKRDTLRVKATSTDIDQTLTVYSSTEPDVAPWISHGPLKNKGDGTYDKRITGVDILSPYYIKVEATPSGSFDIILLN